LKSVISGDMRVGNDTSHAASGLSALHAAFLSEKPLGLFDWLKRGNPLFFFTLSCDI